MKLKLNLKKILSIFLVILMVIGNYQVVHAAEASNSLNGTYSIVVEGYDWGPGVSKAIVALDKPINGMDKSKLAVQETKLWYTADFSGTSVQQFNRKVTDAYNSDAKGNKVNGSSKFFTVELYVSPNDGVPFLYNMKANLNNWAEKYGLTISLAKNSTVVQGNNVYNTLNINQTFTNKIMPQADLFTKSQFTSSGITYSYASYQPAKDNKKHPLIVWFHGGGEGGTDPNITILGGKVTAFASDRDQEKFGGAYVLAPQCPTMWEPDWNNGQKTNDASPFTETTMDLIQNYVKSNPDIDTNRIYVSGCSAGGYMALNMVFNYPKYFAAAAVTCAAFNSSWESDSRIASIKNVPIWFVYAQNDTVDYNKASVPLYNRLVAAGNKNVHITTFKNVVDTSGKYFAADGKTPYEYSGHFTWVYFHNNEVVENGVTIKDWMASQTLKATTNS